MFENLEQILATKNIGDLSFIRMSFYDNRFANEEKENAIKSIIQLVLALKQEKPTSYTILKNDTSLLVTFDFNQQCFVNLAFASWHDMVTPVLKMEVVGKNGMIQFDTQADNAYAGTYFQSAFPLVVPPVSTELTTYIDELIEKIHATQEMEVIVG